MVATVLPSPRYLAEVERSFTVVFPEAFHSRCRRADEDWLAGLLALRRGSFITDIATFETINAQIGREEWGDYERILAGKEHPKSGRRLWGGLLPFYFEPAKPRRSKSPKLAGQIYGFASDEPGHDKVLVWSIHCIVHSYPTFDAWLNAGS